MMSQTYIAAPIISSRNKSLVSLNESLKQGFLKHNLHNKSQTMLTTVIDDNSVRRPACVSPNNSSEDLQRDVTTALQEQQQEHEDRQFVSAAEHLSLQPRGPASSAASVAIANAAEQRRKEESAIRKRKALAAKLRARGASGKIVLKPSDFARSAFCKNRKAAKAAITFPAFSVPTAIDMEIHAKHSHVLYNFVRKGTDLDGFKKCVRHIQNAYPQQQPFRCSNRFGESLMHLVCRRGRTDMARFLVEEVRGCSPSEMLSIRDDCHKTPLHDACWTPTPNFELVELILQHAPEQIMMQDSRGQTPFDYVRKEDYSIWLKFLWQRRSLLGVSRPQMLSN